MLDITKFCGTALVQKGACSGHRRHWIFQTFSGNIISSDPCPCIPFHRHRCFHLGGTISSNSLGNGRLGTHRVGQISKQGWSSNSSPPPAQTDWAGRDIFAMPDRHRSRQLMNGRPEFQLPVLPPGTIAHLPQKMVHRCCNTDIPFRRDLSRLFKASSLSSLHRIVKIVKYWISFIAHLVYLELWLSCSWSRRCLAIYSLCKWTIQSNQLISETVFSCFVSIIQILATKKNW